MLDRLPPHALEAEQAVLGAILIDPEAMGVAAEIINAEDFYKAAHRDIFRAMEQLMAQDRAADIVTVTEMLADMHADVSSAYLADLINRTPTSVHTRHYAGVVAEKAMRRRLIGAAGKISSLAYSEGGPPDSIIDDAEAMLYGVHQGYDRNDPVHLTRLLSETYDTMQTREGTGVRVGYPSLDVLTGGFQRSDLILLAARPSVGKTSLALNIAENVALGGGKTVLIFSLEMSREQVALRLLSSVARIEGRRLKSDLLQEIDHLHLAIAMHRLSKAEVLIDDSPTLTTIELRTRARRQASQTALDLVIVDYLQLMHAKIGKDANRVQEVSEISRGLKSLARELQVPVLALSQLSRQVEGRDSRKPRLSDLRDSGGLEQDSDLVIFLWRDLDMGSRDPRGETVTMDLAKHRNGPTADGLHLWFQKEYTRFE